MNGFMRSFGEYDHFSVGRDVNGGGGLVLLWRRDWAVKILSSSLGHIDSRISLNDNTVAV